MRKKYSEIVNDIMPDDDIEPIASEDKLDQMEDMLPGILDRDKEQFDKQSQRGVMAQGDDMDSVSELARAIQDGSDGRFYVVELGSGIIKVNDRTAKKEIALRVEMLKEMAKSAMHEDLFPTIATTYESEGGTGEMSSVKEFADRLAQDFVQWYMGGYIQKGRGTGHQM